MSKELLHPSIEQYVKDVVFVRTRTPRILRRADIEPISCGKEVVILLSGPSGGGKDTLVRKWLEINENIEPTRNATTRPPRPEEIDNDPHIRMSMVGFLAAQKMGLFIESDFHAGNWYGSLKNQVVEIRKNSKTPILRVDPNGARRMLEMQKNGEAPFENSHLVYAYVVPPNTTEIYKRLMYREIHEGKKKREEAREIVQNRIRSSVPYDLSCMSEAHYLLINHHGKIDSLVSLFDKEINRIKKDLSTL